MLNNTSKKEISIKKVVIKIKIKCLYFFSIMFHYVLGSKFLKYSQEQRKNFYIPLYLYVFVFCSDLCIIYFIGKSCYFRGNSIFMGLDEATFVNMYIHGRCVKNKQIFGGYKGMGKVGFIVLDRNRTREKLSFGFGKWLCTLFFGVFRRGFVHAYVIIKYVRICGTWDG